MKCCTQVYARNSLKAVETYCKAFGAKATPEMFNEAKTEYEHCELSVGGQPVLAVAEWSLKKYTKFLGARAAPLYIIDRYGVCWWIAI